MGPSKGYLNEAEKYEKPYGVPTATAVPDIVAEPLAAPPVIGGRLQSASRVEGSASKTSLTSAIAAVVTADVVGDTVVLLRSTVMRWPA